MKKIKYYRNTVDIDNIEAGALWKLDGEDIVLVDDDQYISLKYSVNAAKFSKAKI